MTLDPLHKDVTGSPDEDIADLLQFPYLAAFEMDENDIPIRRMVWGEREWKPYTVPWPTEDTNRNHDVCRKLQEKIKT